MPDQVAGRRTFVAIIDHTPVNILGDGVRIFADIKQRIARGPGRPSIHATDAYPGLVAIGVEGLDHFIFVEKAIDIETCPRALTCIHTAGKAIPDPCHRTGRWWRWRRRIIDTGEVLGKRPTY
jgi:hypothetical protein